MAQKTIFFAYESGHPENRDAIARGIADYNKYQKSYHATSWEQLKTAGRVLSKNIIDAIDNCTIFACDLTYINHNVLFELGYAVAKSKSLLLLLNESVIDAQSNYSNLRILKNIGYSNFCNSKNISSKLQNYAPHHKKLLDDIVNLKDIERNTKDLFIIDNALNNQASLVLAEKMQNTQYTHLINNPSEVEYQPLQWFIRNILSAKIIIVHLISKERKMYQLHNAELSFYAGLSLGFEKKLLLIAPRINDTTPYNAPIDYTELLIDYGDAEDCFRRVCVQVDEFLKEIDSKAQSATELPHSAQDNGELNLLKLGIGFEIAEHEKEQLNHYFVKTTSYERALKRGIAIFTGRKGSGKTALFYKMNHDLKNNHDEYVLVLQPESKELLDNIERSKIYHNLQSKKNFITTVWKFVLITKLLFAIYESLKRRDAIEFTEVEQEVMKYCNTHQEQQTSSFYKVLRNIYWENSDKNIYENPAILEQFYERVYRNLHWLLIRFFKKQKYKKNNYSC